MGLADPVPQFTYFISTLAERFPGMAYIHLPEPRVAGNQYQEVPNGTSLDFARKAWKKMGGAFFSAGGHSAKSALTHFDVEGRENEAVVFGRYFIANVCSLSFGETRRSQFFLFSPIYQGGLEKIYHSILTTVILST